MNALLRTLALTTLAWAVPLPAAGEVFKCVLADGKVIYQDSPCAGTHSPRPLHIEADRPSVWDELDAEERAAAERQRLRQLEEAREEQERDAEIEQEARRNREAREPPEPSLGARCADYIKRVEQLEKPLVPQQQKYEIELRRRGDDAQSRRVKARALRDKYFTECLGRY